MKTAYDRGYEMGLSGLQWEIPQAPYYYKQEERADWIKGYCRGYLDKWCDA